MEAEKGESGRKEEKARNISSMVFFILFFKKYIKDRLITEDERNLRVSEVGLCRMWLSPDFSYSKKYLGRRM